MALKNLFGLDDGFDAGITETDICMAKVWSSTNDHCVPSGLAFHVSFTYHKDDYKELIYIIVT